MSQPDPIATGFYGKLPGLGDFVTRRLPAQFVQPWDLWLRESLAASKAQLAQEWLDHYLTSPLWRFVLSPGIAGQFGWAGVLMPSVDRVGRYFPLTLACPLELAANPFRVLCLADWFDRAEAVALTGLADEFDLEAFDTRVLHLGSAEPQAPSPAASPSGSVPLGGLPHPSGSSPSGSLPPGGLPHPLGSSPSGSLPPGGLPHPLGSQTPDSLGGNAWQIHVPSPDRLTEACPVLLARALEEIFFAYSLWWTAGSERVAPSLLACQGLPDPDGFAALLAGDWAGRGWLRLGPA
jgi:type VI secretion system protein ImpM